MEVYVDNIVLKSKKREILPKDMRKTFNKIRQVSMKLNKKKCVWSTSSKCLGFKSHSEAKKQTSRRLEQFKIYHHREVYETCNDCQGV